MVEWSFRLERNPKVRREVELLLVVVVGRQGRLDIADLFEIVLVGFQHFVHIAREEEEMIALVWEAGLVYLMDMVDMVADVAVGMADLIDIVAEEVAIAHIDHIVGTVGEVEAAHMVGYTDCTVAVDVAVVEVEVEDIHMTEDGATLEAAHKEMLEVARKEMLAVARKAMLAVARKAKAVRHMGMAGVDHRESGTGMVDHAMDIADGGMGMDAQVKKSDLADLDHTVVDRQLATL